MGSLYISFYILRHSLDAEEIVDGTRGNARDGILGREAFDLGLHRSRCDVPIPRYEVRNDTSNVRGGHRSSGDGVRSGVGGADPGGDDGCTRGKDIDDGTVVGIGGTSVGHGGSTDGDGRGSAGR